MQQIEGPRQGYTTALLAALAFALGAAGAFALAWVMSHKGSSALAGVGIFFAFGWVMATISALALLAMRHGDLRGARIRTGADGSSIRARGDAYFEMRSRAPALFMASSAVLLLIGEALLMGARQTTPLGAGVGAVLAILIGNGARAVWPRPDKALPPA